MENANNCLFVPSLILVQSTPGGNQTGHSASCTALLYTLKYLSPP